MFHVLTPAKTESAAKTLARGTNAMTAGPVAHAQMERPSAGPVVHMVDVRPKQVMLLPVGVLSPRKQQQLSHIRQGLGLKVCLEVGMKLWTLLTQIFVCLINAQ